MMVNMNGRIVMNSFLIGVVILLTLLIGGSAYAHGYYGGGYIIIPPPYYGPIYQQPAPPMGQYYQVRVCNIVPAASADTIYSEDDITYTTECHWETRYVAF